MRFDLDEDRDFGRPTKYGSRPRTKQRPAHESAVPGFVTAVDRGRYTLVLDLGGASERTVTAMKARELGRERVVVGDTVDLVGDTSGTVDTLARIVRITPRRSVLRRTADDADPYERIVVANADQLVIVTALADPPPRTGMIDRAVVAAYDAGLDVMLCLTKADLGSPTELEALYAPAGVQIVVTRPAQDGGADGRGADRRSEDWPGADRRAQLSEPPPAHGTNAAADSLALDPASVEEVRAHLLGRISVLLGHSGVGKSTLVNALVPDAARVTGAVNDVTGRGRHTSTSVIALPLAGPEASRGGWIIDTPGIRSLGLAHVETEHVVAAFDDLDAVIAKCPRGCTHLESAPDCALDEWLAATTDPVELAQRTARVSSLRRLLASRGGSDQ